MNVTRMLSIVGLVLGAALSFIPSTNAQTLPALPRSYIDTSYPIQTGLTSPGPPDANSPAQSARARATILSKAPLSTGGTPDPTLLPFANTSQVPLTAIYNALNVPGIAAGGYYFDPLTGVKVYKLTSSVFPTTGFSWTHDYAEGGDEVSLPLNASGTRAIKV
jgi:hypothetical protein